MWLLRDQQLIQRNYLFFKLILYKIYSNSEADDDHVAKFKEILKKEKSIEVEALMHNFEKINNWYRLIF
jgi:hypothetical protein